MKIFRHPYVISGASGLLLALSFPAWHLYPLGWLALIPLIWQVVRAGRAFRMFFWSGFVFYLVVLHWLMTNVYWAGGWAFWGYVALSAIMAAYWGLLGWAWAWMRGRMPACAGAFAFAVLWLAMEKLQGTLFTGFGWGCLAYGQGADLPLAQLAGLGGAPLVSAVLAGFNALAALALAERRFRVMRIAAAAVLLVGAHALGAAMLDEPDYPEPAYRVGVLQSAFPLEMKWDREYTEEMVRNAVEKSALLDAREPLDLMVWPESLVMDTLEENPRLGDMMKAFTRESEAYLYAGATRARPETGGIYNSSFLITPAGDVAGFYDKVHLAPFGEYVPLGDYLPFIRQVVPAIGEIEHGERQAVLEAGQRRLGPLICFEVLFGSMADSLRGSGADFIAVITNLGWFGASSAIPQELEIARLRAIESRLPLVHCTNTGISGMFDPWGRFELADTWFDGRGGLRRIPGDIPLRSTVGLRMGGAFDLPLPGRRLLPWGPSVIPWSAVALAALLLVVSAFIPRTRPAPGDARPAA